MKFVDLFAGIGGMRLAFEGFGECVFSSEIDKRACDTYELNFGERPHGDITKIDAKDIPDHDILLAGFPCQAFSVAGYQKGFGDERGNLFFEIVRVLKTKRPRSFLLENVKRLVSHDDGNTFSIIINALHDCGYHVDHKVLCSSEYGNLPQHRERVYIVGLKCGPYHFPDKIPLKATLQFESEVEDKYYYADSPYIEMLQDEIKNKNSFYQLRRKYVRENKKGLCPTLTANMGTGGNNVPLIIDDEGIRKLTPRECFRLQGFPDEYKFPDISDTQLYKQIGNSVAVPVVHEIAKQIMKALERVPFL